MTKIPKKSVADFDDSEEKQITEIFPGLPVITREKNAIEKTYKISIREGSPCLGNAKEI